MKKAFLFVITVLIVSCSKKNELPGLYIRTSDVKGSAVSNNQVKKDTLTVVDSEYFEVGLYAYEEGEYYEAQQILVKPDYGAGEDFKTKYYFVTDSLGKEIEYKNSTEFLNFMSARGYDMTDQAKHEWHTDYTFKRKMK